MALLALAHDWRQRSQREVIVLTVDHSLRPEAADEAAFVGRVCQNLNHQHEILTWDAPRPSQKAARDARYALLASAAHAQGAECLLTGHTFDDVVETALIRRRRGDRSSAIAGPSIAAPVPTWPEGRGLTLLRPLVRTKRQDLRDFLVTRGQDWIEDPSNEKPVFERVRVRQFLKRHPALSDLAAAYVQPLQHARAQDLAKLSEQLLNVQVHKDGLIDTDAAEISVYLLRLLARCASGSAKDPRAEAVEDLIVRLDTKGMRQTLGGAWFQRKAKGFLIGRDPEVRGEMTSNLFDGRYIRSHGADMPDRPDLAYLIRQSAPEGSDWRQIISDRLAHLILCYQTPLLSPVQR